MSGRYVRFFGEERNVYIMCPWEAAPLSYQTASGQTPFTESSPFSADILLLLHEFNPSLKVALVLIPGSTP